VRLRGKLVGDIDPTDLKYLYENQVGESRQLDYKLELPGNSSKEKKEFLADATALATIEKSGLIVTAKRPKCSAGTECAVDNRSHRTTRNSAAARHQSCGRRALLASRREHARRQQQLHVSRRHQLHN